MTSCYGYICRSGNWYQYSEIGNSFLNQNHKKKKTTQYRTIIET